MERIILVKNVIQQTNQHVFVSFRDGIDPQIVYKMQEILECLFHRNTGTLRQQSCLYPVPYRCQTVTPKRKSLQ